MNFSSKILAKQERNPSPMLPLEPLAVAASPAPPPISTFHISKKSKFFFPGVEN